MTDQIDLSTLSVFNSPDVRSWPVTVQIVALDQTPQGGYTLTFNRPLPDTWKAPTSTPGDNIQFTVWAVIPGVGAEGFIQMWQGRPMGDGAIPSILTRFGPDGWAGHLQSPVTAYQPKAGDTVGILVTAGDARGQGGVTSVPERSNVVAFQLPASDAGHWEFAGPTPPPQPPPPTPPSDDLLAQIKQLFENQVYVATVTNRFFGTFTVTMVPKTGG